MKSINHNELDEMPKMKGGNSKRGKKEPTTEVVIKNSLKVIGKFTLVHEDGTEEEIDGRRSFCRCGLSAAMPYCDNTHRKSKLDDVVPLSPEESQIVMMPWLKEHIQIDEE
jgi:CDGSH-type Zn-finger protein